MQFFVCVLGETPGPSVRKWDLSGEKLILGIEDGEQMVVLTGHALKNQVRAEFDSTERAAPEEDDRDTTGSVGQGEFKTGDLVGPGLHS